MWTKCTANEWSIGIADADNRITEVETSAEGQNWHHDARYFYYPHGPQLPRMFLKRSRGSATRGLLHILGRSRNAAADL